MSDLQCPATVVFADPASVLAGRCAARNVAGVFATADPAARAAAARLGGPIQIIDGELAEGVERLADLHRGETVVVVAAPELIRDALERPDLVALPVEVAIDGSGWRVLDPRR